MSADINQQAGDSVPAFTGVVALDGPSGTGKSTVARRLALELGARYLDTGAMYRAVTAAVLTAGVDLSDAGAIAEVAGRITLEITTEPEPAVVRVDGSDVTDRIRSAEVTAAVSAVSAVPAVRELLVAEQRRLIGAGGIVVEGRDIGSVVWPTAEPKVYLTASEVVRARRRAGETGGDVAAVAEAIARRDRLDSTRVASPAVRPDGAVELDTSDLTIDQVVKTLVDMTLNR